jgi:hypothetical protein
VRFAFGSSFRMRVHAFGGLAAALGRGKPRQGEPSWPPWLQQGAVLLRLLLPPASPRARRIRCCLELQQGELP